LAIDPATAAIASMPGGFDGAALSLGWSAPFAGLIASIAVVPLLAPKLWHDRYGTIAAAWTVALLIPLAAVFGPGEAAHTVAHAIIAEYIPFLAILFALFTVAGGICVRGALAGTPSVNTALLALGALLASFMGTTGASMLLIRPLLTANATRKHVVHSVVFFIVLVGNVGGALTPLGDPPLFIGFLKGVDFFWTTRAMALPTLFVAATLLAVYFVLDSMLCRREPPRAGTAATVRGIAVEGRINFVLLAAVVSAVLMSGLWHSGVRFTVMGTDVEPEDLLRDCALIGLGLASLAVTPAGVRQHNQFHWAPIIEVAKIFAAIFITIAPVLAMLGAGRAGAFAGLLALLRDDGDQPRHLMIFWTSGLLSAFLDNAPTYLVFFNLSGGDAQRLMGPLAQSLLALSMGAVYFGALTYIGNAPNFMIKAIAEDRGVAMPTFFAYLAYAAVLLLPLFVAISIVWLQ
jgi:Na+/H+ antiporter NhaD/arsenite permease-like protein